MMKSVVRVLLFLVFLSLWGICASAGEYVFDPGDPGLEDLSHGHYYTWGIDFSLPENETIAGVSILFNDIRNWNFGSNDLWLHLLDSAPTGVERHYDNLFESVDAFAGQGVLLNHWHNLPAWPEDIAYQFNTSDLDALVSYLADGTIGFGIDPDCHFYNAGVSFMIETTPVPAPATFGLLGLGLVALVGLSRKRRKQ
jgi:hypothetical protein